MKKTKTLALLGMSAVLVAAAAPMMKGTEAAPIVPRASAKATCAMSETTLIDLTTAQAWTTILSNEIKTANKSDLFCDVSLETGLVTKTMVASKGGKKDTSTADAEIRVRCLINGQEAFPGEVVFGARTQEMSATFQGLIAECFSVDEEGNVVLDETCVEPEELELITSTMDANSFNFVFGDCPSGSHTIEVQAMVQTSAYAEDGVASAFGLVGKGTTTVEEVRMVQNEFAF